ncbi:MAG: hypothetical protein HYR85_20710 [Planctomycetes bacterium]|nr:hypothetical protein [Planctomycetota bacterium]MBI3846129.1 hypothetical protein [Planctomycetota bacterium]
MAVAAASTAFAYRPFRTTDAAIAEPGRVEIEYGAIGVEQNGPETTLRTSDLRLDLGVADRFEFVLQGASAKREGESDSDLVDPAAFVKAIVRRGVLQRESGPSLAVQSGVLLPETIDGSRRTGLETLAIASDRFGDLTLHLDAGMAVDREEHDAQAVWGVVVEHSLTSQLRVAAEVFGETQASGSPDDSALVGAILDFPEQGIALDSGFRAGLTDGAEDWSVTVGVTIAFALPGASGR